MSRRKFATPETFIPGARIKTDDKTGVPVRDAMGRAIWVMPKPLAERLVFRTEAGKRRAMALATAAHPTGKRPQHASEAIMFANPKDILRQPIYRATSQRMASAILHCLRNGKPVVRWPQGCFREKIGAAAIGVALKELGRRVA